MMDLLTMGADAALVGGIIALCNVIKGFDKENKFKRFYPLLPLALGVASAYFKTAPFSWQAYGVNAIVYVGAASYLFQFGKTTILNK